LAFGRSHGPTFKQRRQACRRFLLLLYATATVYFFYAPWNYLLLAALLFRLGKRARSEVTVIPVDTR
jgi:hypothetical protein